MTVVVLGAGRGIGREITRQLVADGREVRAVTRSGGVPDGAHDVRDDLMDQGSTLEAVRGASVIHLAANVLYTSWTEMLPTVVDNTIAAAEAVGANSAFDATFGPLPVTPHEQAIAETARWYRPA